MRAPAGERQVFFVLSCVRLHVPSSASLGLGLEYIIRFNALAKKACLACICRPGIVFFTIPKFFCSDDLVPGVRRNG